MALTITKQFLANEDIDHGLLLGLGDDDHTQYLLLAGRSGGQIAIGGTDASDTLTLQSTSNATKGNIILGIAGNSVYDEVNDRLGIGTATPAYELDVNGDINLPEANGIYVESKLAIKVNVSVLTDDIRIGYLAGVSATQNSMVSIGREAGRYNTGTDNVFIGRGAGIGSSGVSTGLRNMCVGTSAGGSLTTGSRNMFFGRAAGFKCTSGIDNVCIGEAAGFNLTSSLNTIIGGSAGDSLTTGQHNTLIGYQSGQALTTTSGNIFIGLQAGYSSTAQQTTSVGWKSGFNAGNGCVMLGYFAGFNETGSNKLYIDNSSTTTPLIYGDFSTNTLTIHDSLIVNESGNDADSRFEGSTDANLLYIDAGTDRIGIGTATPSAQLHTTKGQIVGHNRYTTTQTLDADDYDVACNTDGGAWTLSLPAGVEGTYYRITNTGTSSNNLTITPNGVENLIGVNSSFILADNETLIIIYDATDGWN